VYIENITTLFFQIRDALTLLKTLFLGKIGSVALKDHKNKKIPSKELCYVKYHRKMEPLPENSIMSGSVMFGGDGVHLHPLEA
jgi:hypothetical protein